MNRGRLLRLIYCLAALAPLNVFAAPETRGTLEHLGADAIIMAILASNTILLLGFLIRLREMRGSLSQKTTALDKSEKHIRLMGDNLPNVTIFQLTCSPLNVFSFAYLSKGFEQALGIERDLVIHDAKLAFDHLYEADIPLLKTVFEQGKKNLFPTDLEIRILDIAGNLKWLHISAVPHWENDALVWDGFMQDISNSKNIEDALTEEKHNLQNLFETIDDLLLVCDMSGNLLHTNPSVEHQLLYSKKELDEMSLFELYPEKFRSEAYQVIALMQTEPSTTCSLPLQTKPGGAFPVEMNLFKGSWRNKNAIYGVARDVAGRQQIENALRESQQMLQTIMNTIPSSLFWKDKDSIYLGCNKAFIKECGLSTIDEVVGKTPYDLFDSEIAADLIRRDQAVITSSQPMLNTLRSHAYPDGSVGWRDSSKIPLLDRNGQTVGVLGVWRDVTEQAHAEERLKRTLEDMERFNQLMRGRERRTLELKAEINQLLTELGRENKYKTTTDTLS